MNPSPHLPPIPPGARIDTLVTRNAERMPDRIALIGAEGAHGSPRITWLELETAVGRAASAFCDLGAGPHTRVAISLDNSIEHAVALLAAWRCEAAAVLINPATPAQKLGTILDDAKPSCVVLQRRHIERLAGPRPARVVVVGDDGALHGAESNAGGHLLPFAELLGGSTRWARAAQSHEDTLALLLYTSGSTGEAKGVMHGHHGLLHVTQAIVDYLEVSSDDIVLTVLPLSFGYGLTQLLVTLSAGATLILERSFTFPQAVAARLARERATLFAIVPTMAALLAQTDLSRHDLSALRTITNAGAALPTALARALRDKLPHTGLVPMYGQTECVRASYLPAEEVERRPASIGRGIPGQLHWLIDAGGARLPPGSTGELVVAGPHVMLGYWNRPEETARKMEPGPTPGARTLRTGDLFHEDEDGWLTFVSRTDDIIKTRGEKVSPRAVEDALHRIDGVAHAAVAGVPHPVLGEAVWAWVVPRPGAHLEARAVARACGPLLEDFAIPRHVVVLDALPMTPNGKIDTQALRASAAGQGE